ncbi:DivIVA domain-containing protein [Ruania halotolerans]|uniref:DivIVA domain-containing protein n=1 Tax=Ruania halotolerans TaxID=2897773 RepID=UPI001E604122|nr:DivIVA domain-containing protein [Ruania halotolerans]UFU05114.1 DivIVA domain-containing protein [Ruania halotolerans]
MALLTADDVLNKKFQPTKFREGYDQDEVDDFLDEVVNTLRVVGGENEELKAKLEAAERRIAELSGGAGTVPAAAPAETPAEQTTQFSAVGAGQDTVAAEAAAPEADSDAAQAPAEVSPQVDEATTAAATGGNEPESATGMLQLAQRLHDEYVSNGKAEADRLLAEAQAEGERLTREADEQRNRTLSQLESERSLLERKIDELRVFERDYRTRLKSYLEGLLSDVEGRGSIASQYTSGEQSDSRRP